jgi:hypothetical protein
VSFRQFDLANPNVQPRQQLNRRYAFLAVPIVIKILKNVASDFWRSCCS